MSAPDPCPCDTPLSRKSASNDETHQEESETRNAETQINSKDNDIDRSSLVEDDGDAFSVDWGPEMNEDGDTHGSAPPLTPPSIVVGYAFGPKKMSTMGLVMAEASKTQFNLASTTSTNQTTAMTTPSTVASADAAEQQQKEHQHVEIIFEAGQDLRKIVRHFHSSCCSSVEAENSTTTSTGTRTASTVSHSWTATNSNHTPFSHHHVKKQQHQQSLVPVRVSFVPLDLEIPIEEQHGGRIDVILHKLTEDILTCSQWQDKHHHHHDDKLSAADGKDSDDDHPMAARAAMERVQRLCDFSARHACPLVDDPRQVQRLMNRAHIAQTLATCLPGVTTASGRTVAAPPHVVLMPSNKKLDNPLALIQRAGMEFPLMVKPLTAAGTKASHSMAVLLQPHALKEQQSLSSPCLIQPYVNHNAWLYKVYVLGDFVSVHKRRSLPNLPRRRNSNISRIAFDSQRPYPRLRDFGYDMGTQTSPSLALAETSKKTPTSIENGNSNHHVATSVAASPSRGFTHTMAGVHITAEEVQPVVEALKQALRLELFGFDVILAASDSDDNNDSSNNDRNNNNTLYVVDVNYFPSYKEVPNFAGLLAKFLTDRALYRRQQQQQGEEVGQAKTQETAREDVEANVGGHREAEQEKVSVGQVRSHNDGDESHQADKRQEDRFEHE